MSASAELEALRADDDLPVPDELRSAWAVLRRGVRESPELKRGLGFTVIVSLGVTVTTLVTPVLVQKVFDNGFTGGFRATYVYSICAFALVLVLLAFVAARAAARRLVRAAEEALMVLRVRTFEHIHRLSIAEQSEEKRGVFVARVTADVDALQQFMEWAGIAWLISFAQVLGALILMLVYSWQLTLAVVLLVIPLLLVVGSMQSKLTTAYNTARTRVGEMLSEVSESVMGAAVVRAYGLEEQTDRKVKHAIDERYRAEVVTHFRAATLWPMSSIFYAVALSVVIVLGATYGPSWGLTFGQVTAFLFLADIFLHVFTDLPEVYAETQTAIAGWRKILAVLDLPVEIVEPSPGVELPSGALSVEAQDVRYAYRTGAEVLHGISLAVPAGAHMAIVGETGCGKTTFVKLMSRLADPLGGRILLGGVDLREVAPDARRAGVRMVPQDGFLFDTTVRENVRYGREGASDRDVRTAFEELGLGAWVALAPRGPRHEGGRARRGAQRGRTPARGAGARADRGPGPADPRRGDQCGGPRHGAAHHGGAAPAVGGADHGDDRTPPLHGGAGGPGLRLRRGHARGGGYAHRAGGPRRRLRRPVRELARQHPGRAGGRWIRRIGSRA